MALASTLFSHARPSPSPTCRMLSLRHLPPSGFLRCFILCRSTRGPDPRHSFIAMWWHFLTHTHDPPCGLSLLAALNLCVVNPTCSDASLTCACKVGCSRSLSPCSPYSLPRLLVVLLSLSWLRVIRLVQVRVLARGLSIAAPLNILDDSLLRKLSQHDQFARPKKKSTG